jgi:hypothetical protein
MMDSELDINMINVGDTVYCIFNDGVDLEIGKGYIVEYVWEDMGVFRVDDMSRWMCWRFSKDPNHINIVKNNSKKYNL